MVRTRSERRWVPPPAEWDRLDADVTQIVFSNLSLRNLASLAVVCKEYKAAYLRKAESERQSLLAVTEGTFGQENLAALVTPLARPLCGLEDWPNIPNHQGQGNVTFMAIPPDAECKRWFNYYRPWWVPDTRRGAMRESYSTTLKLHGDIVKIINDNGHEREQRLEFMFIRFGRDGVVVQLEAEETDEPLVLGLGLILAISRAIEAEVQEPWRRTPLTVNLLVTNYLGTKREAEDLIAPLRPIATDIALYKESEEGNVPVTPLGIVQERELVLQEERPVLRHLRVAIAP